MAENNEPLRSNKNSRVRVDTRKSFPPGCLPHDNLCSKLENSLNARPKLSKVAVCSAKCIFDPSEIRKYCFGQLYDRRPTDRPRYPDNEKLELYKAFLKHLICDFNHEMLRICFDAVNHNGRGQRS